MSPEQAGKLTIGFASAPRQRVKQAKADLSKLEVTGVATRGSRLAAKPVNKLKHEPAKGGARKGGAKKSAGKATATRAAARPATKKPKRPVAKKKPGPSGGIQGSLF